MAWTNIEMYCATLPDYKDADDKKGDVLRADDPRNQQKIKEFIENAR